jgi:hypothetical protein
MVQKLELLALFASYNGKHNYFKGLFAAYLSLHIVALARVLSK